MSYVYDYEDSILKSLTFYSLYLSRYILFILALSEYFCFDKMKYTLEEFFTDVKTFKVSYFSLWQKRYNSTGWLYTDVKSTLSALLSLRLYDLIHYSAFFVISNKIFKRTFFLLVLCFPFIQNQTEGRYIVEIL